MDKIVTGDIVWRPDPAALHDTHIMRMLSAIQSQHGIALTNYPDFYRWSLAQMPQFWSSMWHYAQIIGTPGEQVLQTADNLMDTRWFVDAKLNFAQNLLRRRGAQAAIIFQREDGLRDELSFDALYDRVSSLVSALQDFGIRPGDRVAACLPNTPEAIVAMLATTAVGAIWSACSPDFGVQGILDRFAQITPKVLFTVNGYIHAGKQHGVLERINTCLAALDSVEQVVLLPYVDGDQSLVAERAKVTNYHDLMAHYPPCEIEFTQFPFEQPLYIVYSSGTTGLPKAIVHSAGGTLIQHCKEHLLHGDVQPTDRLFYFTTCGWMMWNWQVSALACGASLVLYDGSPMHPDANALFALAEREGITLFGTSAKFIDALRKTQINPAKSHNLHNIRVIFSTGSPLSVDGFDYIYQTLKMHWVRLSSISGGSDIISCFALGCPILPVVRGELQVRGLGMAVDVFDEAGQSTSEAGELVCRAPFPSMPLGFWGDPERVRYRAAYFDSYPNVWTHGDCVSLMPSGGMIFHGRSDAVLNPGGVRIGTAEIYRLVEMLDEVLESIAVGQEWQGDVRVVLFVKLRPNVQLSDHLRARIRQQIKAGATPRHVPAKVIQVDDMPRTYSGKLVELAVRAIIHGQPIKNRNSLINPQVLEQFAEHPELQF